MSAKAFVFAVLIAFAAVPAFSQTPPLCKSLDPAPLIAGGILGDWKETIGKDVWFATEKGGARCSGYNSSDPACQFDDPGMVRVNVRGRDYFYAPPPGMIVNVTVEHDAAPRCEIGAAAQAPPTGSVTPREFPMIGYGLVVGLDGTGDDLNTQSGAFQTLKSLLVRDGHGLFDASVYQRRVAAVMVTSRIQVPASPKATADIRLVAIGDAKSLAGGALLMTSLLGSDARTYAIGQGVLQPCPGAQKSTVACIPGGAIIAH